MGTDQKSKRIVVGITGASGAIYAQTVIQGLIDAAIEVHLVVSKAGERLLRDELDCDAMGLIESIATPKDDARINLHNVNDIGSTIASGSFVTQGMIIVPCSSNSLNQIAGGLGQNLLTRAAAVTLKERRPLILCHRESPLSFIDIESMKTLTLAGATVAPANPGWYLKPTTLKDLSDFVAARLLDCLHVKHNLSQRWGE